MRPEFDLQVEDPLSFLVLLKKALPGHARCAGQVFKNHAVIRMRDEVRHFWSPYLYLEARLPDEYGEVETPSLRGRFAPHPNVWTLFMAIYGLLSLSAIAGLMYGASQWWLGWTPWGFTIVPAAVLLFAFVYGAAFIGQGLGAEEMYELRSFVEQVE